MRTLLGILNDAFLRRMLYFSISYSLYLTLPVVWWHSRFGSDWSSAMYGLEASGYYGIITAVVGFLITFSWREGSIFPGPATAKIIVLFLFVYSIWNIVEYFIGRFDGIFTETFSMMLLRIFDTDFDIGLIFLIVSMITLIGALFKSPHTTART